MQSDGLMGRGRKGRTEKRRSRSFFFLKGWDSETASGREFVRARKALQLRARYREYASHVDGNNGGYAKTTGARRDRKKTGKSPSLPLVESSRLWRTKDGVLAGSKLGARPKVLKERCAAFASK